VDPAVTSVEDAPGDAAEITRRTREAVALAATAPRPAEGA
ncbi:hypothetical protein L603_000600000010, partial [Cellulosimicrobium cellulans J34]